MFCARTEAQNVRFALRQIVPRLFHGYPSVSINFLTYPGPPNPKS